jgi:very-short-patch-repair endonuclease
LLVDLVVFGADGTKIAIECDGDYWHGDDQFEKDMQRQEILERAGWQFFRILYSHYINDKHQAKITLLISFNSQAKISIFLCTFRNDIIA